MRLFTSGLGLAFYKTQSQFPGICGLKGYETLIMWQDKRSDFRIIFMYH